MEELWKNSDSTSSLIPQASTLTCTTHDDLIREYATSTFVTTREALDNVPAVGWLAPLDHESPDARARYHAFEELHPGVKNAAYVRYNPEDNGHTYDEDKKEVAFRLFANGIKQPRSFDMPSPYYKADFDPEPIRTATNKDKKTWPNGWPGLHNYQKDGVALLMAGERGERGAAEGAYLLDDMGLGKSIQVLSVIGYDIGTGRTSLIVAPAALIPNWLKEIRKWLGSKPTVFEYPGKHSRTIITVEEILSYDIVLTSYNRVATEASQMDRFMQDMSYSRRYPYPCPSTRRRVKRGGAVTETILDHSRPSFQLLLANFHRAVFDECHQIRNPRSATTFGCGLLRAQKRIACTGTPLNKDYWDIFSILRLMKVFPFSDRDFFKEHFVKKKKGTSNKYKVRPGDIAPLDVTRNAMLFTILISIMIRRKKKGSKFDGEELIKLPRLVVHPTVELDLDDGVKYSYEDFRYMSKSLEEMENKGYNQKKQEIKVVEAYSEYVKSGRSPTGKDLSWFTGDIGMLGRKRFWPRTEQETQYATRLQWDDNLRTAIVAEEKIIPAELNRIVIQDIGQPRLAAFHPAAPQFHPRQLADLSDDSEADTLEPAEEDIKSSKLKSEQFQKWLEAEPIRWRSTKSEWIVNYVEGLLATLDNNCIIIASEFTSVLDVFCVAFKSVGIKYLRFDGTMSREKRTAAQITYQTPQGARVLLLQSRCGGAGLDFFRANFVILPTPEWSPMDEEQVIGRAWRMGQVREVHVIRTVAKNSIDKRVETKQELKEDKSFGAVDLFTQDAETLAVLSPYQRELREKSIEKLKEMESWTKAQFIFELSEIFVEDDSDSEPDPKRKRNRNRYTGPDNSLIQKYAKDIGGIVDLTDN